MWSNEQTALLIEQYKKHPCLYVVKHKHHYNRKLRSLAIQQIFEEVRKLKPQVMEGDIQKKFMGLRTRYASERKKVLASIDSGMADNEVYKPSLWYYDKLSFLNEHFTMRQAKASFKDIDTDRVNRENNGLQQVEVMCELDIVEGNYIVCDDGRLSPINNLEYQAATPSRTITPPAAKKEKIEQHMEKDNPELIVLGEVPKSLDSVVGVLQDGIAAKTQEDTFGEFVAFTLKKIKAASEDLNQDVQLEIHKLLREALNKSK